MAQATFCAFLLVLFLSRPAAQTPVAYRFSFPSAHHLMQVEATFTAFLPVHRIANEPLVSRSLRTPRFAKNVFDVRITAKQGGTDH
jgi:hypothetical protein